MDVSLDSPVQYVPRVGPRMAGLLRKLGVITIYDLLTYIPFRYKDYSLISPIARLKPGETVTVIGTLEYIRTFMTKNGKRLVMGKLKDESGSIEVTWFNQAYLVKILKPGCRLSASGNVSWFGQKIVLSNPEYEVLEISQEEHTSLHTGRLVPVYSETNGLTSKWLRGRIAYLLEHYFELIRERLPESVVREEKLLALSESIRSIHFPKSLEAAEGARDRLAFDELFTFVTRSYVRKRQWQTTLKAVPLALSPKQKAAFITSLPFTLTDDQVRATNDLFTDLSKPIPMNRLLEGDVGAGKTIVAAAGMYAAWLNGVNSALLAPTQILAEQHAYTLKNILTKKHGIEIELVLGGTQKKHIPTPQKDPVIYVGTHALLTPTLVLPRFGFIVIDEQQRFGVNQRALLRKQTQGDHVPHQLTMTATPIPRTIAQTVFGNLDLSVLRSLPRGRKPVKTWVVPTTKREAAYAWMKKELTQNRVQAFIICPLIDESETLKSVRAVTSEFSRLQEIFRPLRVGLLHGRMKAAEKTTALERLRNGGYDILLSTPVVEVGIDIPNATIMLIEASERFGLSQLHQLRGRVGRRDKPSYCLLFTEMEAPEVLRRLKALETVHNGPELAELDLALRGPGELFGTRQHGISGFTLAKLTDTALVSRVQHAAARLALRDPDLTTFPYLRESTKESKIDTVQS